jgi:hypothetical protein
MAGQLMKVLDEILTCGTEVKIRTGVYGPEFVLSRRHYSLNCGLRPGELTGEHADEEIARTLLRTNEMLYLKAEGISRGMDGASSPMKSSAAQAIDRWSEAVRIATNRQ